MFNIGWASCLRKGSTAPSAYEFNTFILMGDTPYTNNTTGYVGNDLVQAAVASTQADMEEHHYEQTVVNPYWQNFIASTPNYYYMADDHEWGGDNWDHTVLQANAQVGIGAVTQADVDNHWDVGNKAVIAYSTRNPSNSDAEAIAEIPSESAELTADNYPVKYFRVGYDVNGNIDNVNPHIELFVIDCISYRDPLAQIDNSVKTMLGKGTTGLRDTDGQCYWLKKYVAESTATFKAIVSKNLYAHASGGNSDMWHIYAWERDHILADFASNSVTGVIWLTGDQHFPHITVQDTDDGDTYDSLAVCACPIGVVSNGTGKAADSTHRWLINYDRLVFGLLEVQQNYIEASVCDLNDGAKLWTGRVVAGSSKLSYENAALTVL